jgi:photosynthetic reaction center H subunit
MWHGAITQYVDVAQLVLYMFWAFFFGLVYYLVRENHREGYPMDNGRAEGGPVITGWPTPAPKIFKTVHGDVAVPDASKDAHIRDLPMAPLYGPGNGGVAYEPTGNPLTDGVGPAAFTPRANRPDEDFSGKPKLVPLRNLAAAGYSVAERDLDPRGLPVIAADGEVGATVHDLWLDVSEMLVRYFEVSVNTPTGVRNVLMPREFAVIKKTRGNPHLDCVALTAAQFAGVPGMKNPDVVTLDEEERVVAYFGGGMLYATPNRAEPLF